MKSKLRFIIGKNISLVCDKQHEDYSSQKLADMSGTNQTTMNRLMRADPEDPVPRVDSVDFAIQALKLEPWAVMVPGADLSLMRNKRLTKLIESLIDCSDETRERIISNALDTIMLEKIKKE